MAYDQRGVCQLKCNEWPLKYVRQTGCTFEIQYKEHIQAIKKQTELKNTLNIYSTLVTHMAQLTKR
jgi:hypothetical protein